MQKNNIKKKVYGIPGLLKEERNVSNMQPNPIPIGVGKRTVNKYKNGRKRDRKKIRAEIIDIEKKTVNRSTKLGAGSLKK